MMSRLGESILCTYSFQVLCRCPFSHYVSLTICILLAMCLSLAQVKIPVFDGCTEGHSCSHGSLVPAAEASRSVLGHRPSCPPSSAGAGVPLVSGLSLHVGHLPCSCPAGVSISCRSLSADVLFTVTSLFLNTFLSCSYFCEFCSLC